MWLRVLFFLRLTVLRLIVLRLPFLRLPVLGLPVLRVPVLAGLLILWGAVAATASPQQAAQLVMVEEDGCIWCARWDAEISAVYPKTAAGQAAPLRRIDLRGPRPDDLAFTGPLLFTPTFVLMVEGREVARIEGYPGEDFFWGLLEQMITRAGIETGTKTNTEMGTKMGTEMEIAH